MAQFLSRRLTRHLITGFGIAGAVLTATLWLLLAEIGQTNTTAQQRQPEPLEADVNIARPGAGSLGDPYYSWMGNTGYDALHYTIDLTIHSLDVPTSTITGAVTLTAEATQSLSTFNLDFLGFTIEQIVVNEAPATFSRLDRELMIIPESPLPVGQRFTVTVAYRGTPLTMSDPALPSFPGVGWLTMEKGIYVLNQPSGASTWFPVNDYPQDKATYTYRITVPVPYIVAANGILEETIDHQNMTTYIWQATDPMASYLTTINIAELEEQSAIGPGGLPIRNYFPIDAPSAITEPFEATAAQIEFFSELLGPYPFEAYGSLVMDANFPAALETQTLPVYGRSAVAVMGERVLAHELAHQWIGNYVSVETWQDIWINEGFATYADWLWVGESQGETAMHKLIKAAYDRLAPDATTARAQLDYAPPGRPPITGLFGQSVYQRGGLTFAALHALLGDETFFEVIRTYIKRYGNGTAGTDEFVAMAEEISGEDLDEFFNAWLFDDPLPDIPQLDLER
jgi:aminopeptidase N